MPNAGVFNVVHTNNHAASHDVTVVRNGEFPLCGECGGRVYFTLVRSGENIALNRCFHRNLLARGGGQSS
jgi:hypothetical protein